MFFSFCLEGGGSGFIGRAVSRALRKIGYSVIIISRQPGLERMSWVRVISFSFLVVF